MKNRNKNIKKKEEIDKKEVTQSDFDSVIKSLLKAPPPPKKKPKNQN